MNDDNKLTKKIPNDEVARQMGAGALEAITTADEQRRELPEPSVAEQEMGGGFQITTARDELGDHGDTSGYEVAATPTVGDEEEAAFIKSEVLAQLHVHDASELPDYEVELQEAESGGRFSVVDADGRRVGEMHFSRYGDEMIVVDRTEVVDDGRAGGAGRLLFEQMVAWSRRSGVKVRPSCAFARKMFSSDASAREVLA